MIPSHELKSLAHQHHTGRGLGKMRRWTQVVAMASAQLSDRHSLRDVASNRTAKARKRYHLGIHSVRRSALARVNASEPCPLYEAPLARLPACCQAHLPRRQFKFKNKLYALAASTIDLCLRVFPRARCGATGSAVKLYIGLEHEGLLPAFVAMTKGKTHDLTGARAKHCPIRPRLNGRFRHGRICYNLVVRFSQRVLSRLFIY